MLSSRTTDQVIDKENIQCFNNYVPQRQNARRVFGKLLTHADNVPAPQQVKLAKPEPELKQVEQTHAISAVKPQLVEQYAAHIQTYLKSRLPLYNVDAGYMAHQPDINVRMRAILIDWLIDVCLKFKLLPQSLFMTVNLVDRYLTVKQVSRQELQLLGVACLMITGKYEEIYPPVLKDYVAVCDNAYKREDVLRMEADVLATLQFDLTQPSSFYFLQLLQQKLQLEPRPFAFVQYVLESVLLDIDSLKYDNLTLVAGAIFLVNKIFKRGRWSHEYTTVCGVAELDAKACAKELYVLMQQVDALGLSAAKRKFSAPVYFEVSRFKVEKVSGSRN